MKKVLKEVEYRGVFSEKKVIVTDIEKGDDSLIIHYTNLNKKKLGLDCEFTRPLESFVKSFRLNPSV